MTIVTIAATSGGAHPPKMLAQQVVNELISVSPTASEEAQKDGSTQRVIFLDVLVSAFQSLQDEYRSELKGQKYVYFDPKMVDPDFVEKVINTLLDKISGSTYELFWKQDHVLMQVRQVLYHNFASAIDIECKWHNDSLH